VPIENEIFTTEYQGWVTSARLPSEKPAASILLLHGWTGNERSMWIFTHGLNSYFIFAPRGPVRAEEGFGWAEQKISGEFASFSDFLQVTDRLADWAAWFPTNYLSVHLPIYLMGFSQGGAIAITLSIRFPERFHRSAVLSGSLPAGSQEHLRENTLAGSSFFFAHGKNDNIVPFTHAQKAAETIRLAGAQVTFCESETGHKLDAQCFRNLYSFMTG
jgi:phospholipase/carboxylesterase